MARRRVIDPVYRQYFMDNTVNDTQANKMHGDMIKIRSAG